MRLTIFVSALVALAPSTSADDADYRCPLYPVSQRVEDQARIARELEFQRYSASVSKKAGRNAAAPASANFIDDYIFGKISADGVPVADITTDQEFVRRVYLDLTGHIPTAAQVTSFLSDSNPSKRNALIDSLLGSPAYVDRWTQWFGDQFKVGSNYYNLISLTSRNLFYRYVRDMVERDRPYNEFAAQMITASGDNLSNAPVNYLVRGFQFGDPLQDSLDALSNNITVNFLGFHSECISCHDGRRHLEPINLFLLGKRRADFWKQAAFLSRLTIGVNAASAYGSSNHVVIGESTAGGYTSTVPSNNPGQRPLRTGGPYTPVNLLTGATPTSRDWRGELAAMITGDRQFARATVNYIWAKLFTQGIVDPPDSWDLARIDPKNPPAPETGFGIQPTHPELIEALATEFINNGYSIQHMIRFMMQSNAYQLSSRQPDGWKLIYASYFAKHIPRRLTAEEVFDAVTIATGTETPMYVEGFDKPLMYATQLPDTTEPRSDGNITYFLNQFGRGDWFNSPRNSTSTILQVLFTMNDNQIMARTLASRDGSRSTRVAALLASNISEDDMVQQLFLSTLGRAPTDDEKAAMQRNRSSRVSREDWLSDLQWALLNKLDFLFNY
jgi:hypothetical protein